MNGDIERAIAEYGRELPHNQVVTYLDFSEIIEQSDMVLAHAVYETQGNYRRGDGNYVTVTFSVLAHSQACLTRQANYHLYKKTWPKYCKSCAGHGTVSWSENQSPVGSGYYWAESFTEICADCIGHHRCPKCWHRHSKSWNNFENREDQTTLDHCVKCGWSQEDRGLPDVECMCWEEDARDR